MPSALVITCGSKPGCAWSMPRVNCSRIASEAACSLSTASAQTTCGRSFSSVLGSTSSNFGLAASAAGEPSLASASAAARRTIGAPSSALMYCGTAWASLKCERLRIARSRTSSYSLFSTSERSAASIGSPCILPAARIPFMRASKRAERCMYCQPSATAPPIRSTVKILPVGVLR
jgi:hypothetical protein